MLNRVIAYLAHAEEDGEIGMTRSRLETAKYLAKEHFKVEPELEKFSSLNR